MMHAFLWILFPVICDWFANGSNPWAAEGMPVPVSIAFPPETVDSIYILPVVVHVMHTGSTIGAPDNPTDSLISVMLGLMNDAFQKNGPFYGGADVNFGFQLAHRSPDCTGTSGILRIDASGVPNYPTGGITADTISFPNSAHEVFIKSLSRWPNTDYLNVWIVNKIDSNDFWPGGFAYFPEYNSALVDGIVVRASVVNGSNKTIIHELGHYFSLYHSFGDAWGTCITETECETEGDRVCDTENCMYEFNCNESINGCSGEQWLIADSTLGYTVLNNFMGFTDCQWMFTEGQKLRMQAALDSFRPGLLSSLALSESAEAAPAPACIPTALHELSEFYGIERIEFGSLEVYSNTSLRDAAFYIDRTCNQVARVTAGDSVHIRVTPAYTNPMQIKVYLDWNGNGVLGEADELILSHEFAGVLADTIVIPLSGTTLCTPLRLRFVTDVPGAPEPTSCLLTGTLNLGVGQIEDYTVIIEPRPVYSVTSGDWDIPDTWSCVCIPGDSDFVTISQDHQILVAPDMGILECARIHLEPGAQVDIQGELRVTSACE